MKIKEEVRIMSTFKYIKSALLIATCALVLTTSNICIDEVTAQTAVTPAPISAVINGDTIPPLVIVKSPKEFLNKTITMNAKFDKFSTLGLDYKSAFRSSEDYISFLIKRDDTTFDIPLSEMKLFIKRTAAEKFIELKTNDEIQIEGKVFSDALGDPWIEVTKLTLIKKAPDKDGVK